MNLEVTIIESDIPMQLELHQPDPKAWILDAHVCRISLPVEHSSA